MISVSPPIRVRVSARRDIVGFTDISAKLSPEKVMDMLVRGNAP